MDELSKLLLKYQLNLDTYNHILTEFGTKNTDNGKYANLDTYNEIREIIETYKEEITELQSSINIIMDPNNHDDITVINLAPSISNFGNTCFHNAIIQLLFRMDDWITNIIDNKNIGNNFITLFRIMRNMTGNCITINTELKLDFIDKDNNLIEKSIKPYDLIMDKKCYLLGTGRQQDANELMEYILGNIIDLNDYVRIITKKSNKYDYDYYNPLYSMVSIKRDYRCAYPINKICNNKRIKDMFNITDTDTDNEIKEKVEDKILDVNMMKTIETCCNDIYGFDKFDENNLIDKLSTSIRIELYDNTYNIEDLFRYTIPNKFIDITPDGTYNAIKIYEKNILINKYEIKLNKYLIIQLKIFKHQKDGTSVKNYNRVDLVDNNNRAMFNGIRYIMTGVLIHIGRFSGGHYVSYIKRGDYWYLYNDEKRRKTTKKNWNEIEFKTKHGQQATPYIILYERDDQK
jgi:hypothetical protein